MEEAVPDVEYDQLHHFISKSPWSFKNLISRIADFASKKLTSYSKKTKLPIGLYIDESSFGKKGKYSVGVSRQWLGSKGKVDNGQVAVFSSLGCGNYNALIDCRLFLPKCWTDDPERCNSAGIPKEEQVFKTKIELAIESVKSLVNQGINYGFVAVDALYGSSFEFINTMDELGQIILGRVRNNIQCYLEEPTFCLPDRKSNKGRKPTKYKTETPAYSMKTIALAVAEAEWRDIDIRDTTKATLRVQAAQKAIWLYCEEQNQLKKWTLVITRESKETSIKEYTYTVTNSTETLTQIIQMDRQRYWIERSFQDAKNEVGMDEYQVRNYLGFYHHMSLSMLAYLFLMEERMDNHAEIPLLSCADIRRFFEFLLPNRVQTLEDLYLQMMIRHFKRQASIESAYRSEKDVA